MIYIINGVEFDSDEVVEHLTAFNILYVCKSITEKTGCPLSVARDYYYEMLKDHGIEESQRVKEIRSYLIAEYED